MAYFAWHKLARRRLEQSFTPGCTSVCCCPIECGSNDPPPECAIAFYPVEFPSNYCCDVVFSTAWCGGCPYNDQTCIESCHDSETHLWNVLCRPWIGVIDENGNIDWTNFDPVIWNCSGEEFACNSPSNMSEGPLTTRLAVGDQPMGGTSAFASSRPNIPDYVDIWYVDPAFAPQRPPRYYETPLQGSNPTRLQESPMCLRLKIPSAVPTRTMVLSGYNKYRYTGYLTNDSEVYSSYANGSNVYAIPKIIHDPGASGLSQMEGSLGRSFPLPDDVLTYPLWGASESYIPVSEECDPNPCIFTYMDHITTEVLNDFCVGDDCLKVQQNDATGHYMTMQSLNFTGHYHSFSGYNPYVKFFEGATAFNSNNGIEPNYEKGTGLPPCSLYSLAWALYDRSWRAVGEASDAGGSGNGTEQELITEYPTQFGGVRNTLNSLLGDDPRNLTGSYGESVVTYWFDQLNNKLKDFVNHVISQESLDGYILDAGRTLGGTVYEYGAFTTPKVILWNRTGFLNATTNTDRWKNLYIPGSGNILFDTGCTHTDNNWKAFKFYLDEGSHDPQWGSEHSARMLQFRVCDASDDQITSQICTSMRVLPAIGNTFCELCATSGSPFEMDSATDCIEFISPELYADPTVGTDYTG